MWAINVCEISGIGEIFRRCHFLLFYFFVKRSHFRSWGGVLVVREDMEQVGDALFEAPLGCWAS